MTEIKSFSLFCILFFMALLSGAQSWNPYVAQGIMDPAPLLPVHLNGTGVASFKVGNSGSSPIPYDPDIPRNNISLVIPLSYGLPNIGASDHHTALTAIGGTWAKLFNWEYDSTLNEFKGLQNQTLPGQSQGTVTIQYKVTKNSAKTAPENGFKVILLPPPALIPANSTGDDNVSCYTFTEAVASGDKGK
jgi:hypothetical protein